VPILKPRALQYQCLLARAAATLRGVMEPRGRACCMSSRAGGGRMPAGAMREGRQGARVSMAGQEQGSRRATARREERGTEGGARINRTPSPPCPPKETRKPRAESPQRGGGNCPAPPPWTRQDAAARMGVAIFSSAVLAFLLEMVPGGAGGLPGRPALAGPGAKI
jgi:hypothetical protein